MSDFGIIRKFIPNLKCAQLVETFSSVDYGGDFKYFSIERTDRSGTLYVCLLRASWPILDPFDSSGTFPAIDGVEDGYGLAVVGCFSTLSGEVLKRTDPRAKSGVAKDLADDLRVCVDGKDYYLYLLVPPSTAQG